MYRLLAIAKYEDRYVIPKAHVETARELDELGCSLDTDGGPGMGGPAAAHSGPHNDGDAGPAGPYGNTPGMPLNSTVDSYNVMVGDSPLIKTRPATPGRINLLNWNGTGGAPEGLFPPKLGLGGARSAGTVSPS
jgi:nitrate reductase beta subunit